MESSDICYTKFTPERDQDGFSEKIVISSRDSLHAVYQQILEMSHQTKMDFSTAMSRLEEAYERKDYNSLRRLFLEPMFNPMVRDKNKNTIFHAICSSFSPMIVYLLLEDQRIDPNTVNDKGETALYLACQRGRIEIVHVLLSSRKIDPTISDFMAWTPLHAACFYGHVKIVDMLLKDSRIDPNSKNIYRNTPLHMACENIDYRMVECLMQDSRVDPNVRCRGIRPFKIITTRLKSITKNPRDLAKTREDVWMMVSIYDLLRVKTKMNLWTMLRDFFEI